MLHLGRDDEMVRFFSTLKRIFLLIKDFICWIAWPVCSNCSDLNQVKTTIICFSQQDRTTGLPKWTRSDRIAIVSVILAILSFLWVTVATLWPQLLTKRTWTIWGNEKREFVKSLFCQMEIRKTVKNLWENLCLLNHIRSEYILICSSETSFILETITVAVNRQVTTIDIITTKKNIGRLHEKRSMLLQGPISRTFSLQSNSSWASTPLNHRMILIDDRR